MPPTGTVANYAGRIDKYNFAKRQVASFLASKGFNLKYELLSLKRPMQVVLEYAIVRAGLLVG
jgi:hypothetical protein